MPTQIYFIDTKLENYQTIINSLASTDIYYLIDSSSDGLTQMSNILLNYSNLDSIHVYSHGDVGSLNIGNSIYDNTNISNYKIVLENIGKSLSPTGDILLYGCNVGQDEVGLNFINQIAEFSQADVAASDDLTGNSNLGGDWDLEVISGVVETKTFEVKDYQSVMVDDHSDTTIGATALTGGTVTDGNLEVAGDQDYFKVDLVAGERYLFKATDLTFGTEGQINLIFSDYTGEPYYSYSYVEYDGTLQFLFTAVNAGTYYLSVNEYKNNLTGTYTIEANKVLTSDDYGDVIKYSTTISSGDIINGSIEILQDVDCFKIDLSAGKKYIFEMTDLTLGLNSFEYITLYDANGYSLNYGSANYNNSALLSFSVTNTGSYYLKVGANTIGTYSLKATEILMVDDYGDTRTNATTINLENTINGNIEVLGDIDYLKIDLTEGKRYLFQMTDLTLGLNGNLGLLNIYGGYLKSFYESDGVAQFSYTATKTETYYLKTSSSSNSVGAYSLKATELSIIDDHSDTITNATVMNVGNSVIGNIESNGDEDYFKIDLLAGEKYLFEMTDLTFGINGQIQLTFHNNIAIQPFAYILTENNGVAQYSYTVENSGTYYLSASEYGNNATGNYSIKATQVLILDDHSDTITNATALSLGNIVNGNLEVAGDVDCFKIELVAGQKYLFKMNNLTLGTNSYTNISLYDSNESYLNMGYNTAVEQISYTPTISGTYYLKVNSFSKSTGTYDIKVSEVLTIDDHSDTTTNATALTLGVTTNGNVEVVGDIDYFKVDLVAGQKYLFEMNDLTLGTSGRAYLNLQDSNGNYLNSSWEGYSNNKAQFSYTATTSGTYYLRASEDYNSSTGTYDIKVSEVLTIDDHSDTTTNATALTLGVTTNGNVEVVGDIDYFKVDLVAGQKYLFEMNDLTLGTNGYAHLNLQDSSGNYLNSSGEGYSNNKAQLSYTATTSGTYYLRASESGSDSTGTYDIKVSEISDDHSDTTTNATALTLGVTTNGNVEVVGDIDYFKVDLVAGQKYLFEMNDLTLGTSGEAYLNLQDSNGNYLNSSGEGYSNNKAQFSYTATTSGTYYLRASESGSDSGTYDIKVSEVLTIDDHSDTTTNATALTLGVTTNGNLEVVGDIDYFKVDLVAGQKYLFEMNDLTLGTSGRAYLNLQDSNGNYLNSSWEGYSNNKAQFSYTATTSGTYYLRASEDYNSSTGTYDIKVSEVLTIDDHSDTTTNATALTLGVTTNGNVEVVGDIDYFKVDLVAGQKYLFEMNDLTLGTSGEAYLNLQDSNGNYLNSSGEGYSNNKAQFSYTATTSGTYYLRASESGSDSGTYDIKVSEVLTIDDHSDTTTNATALTLGVTTNGNVEVVGDIDYFKVDLVEGQKYLFEMTDLDLSYDWDSNIELTDSNNYFINDAFENSEGVSQLSYTAETSGTYYLRASSTGTYDVKVSNLSNTTPTITSVSTGSVAENAVNTTVIYKVTASDADANTTLAYSLSGTDANLLNIDSTTGNVTLKSPSDYESKNSYSFNVIASDGTLTATKAVTVNVTNVNETPTITSSSSGTIIENAVTSTVIYKAIATDADANTTLAYSLSGTDASLLNIDSTTGNVTLKSPSDYESKNSYSFNVIASDGSLTATKAITVNVTNVNEFNPTITSSSSGTVTENAITSTVIYKAIAIDADGTTPTYSLSGTDANLLNIDSTTGNVTLKSPANYESKNSYNFNVIASDGTLTATKAVTVNVTNVNETPTITSSSSGTIIENAVTSTVIYKAIATDADANTTLAYSLSGTDASLLNIDSTTGNVTLKSPSDYESKNSYSFNVIASDGSLTATKAITVNVTNVNEFNPTITSSSSGTVTENAITSTVIYKAIAIDADGTTPTYSLSGTDANLLNIDSTTGNVTLKSPANYESKNSYNFNVIASDGTLTATKAITVNVSNVNEFAPTSANKTITINEDTAKVLTLTDFTFSDADADASLTKVKITQVETKGSLKLNGIDVTSNQEILATDIKANKLIFTPILNEFGTSYSNFKFQVSDGTKYSTSSYTTTFNVTQVIDTVSKSTSYTLPSLIENLTLIGTSAINGTGNTLNNVITGNGANNTLDGKAGIDTMKGGLGNDTYIVDNVKDVVTEVLNQGTDTINSTVTYTLSSNVENLSLLGTSVINGIGNSLNNVITGNSANNVLNGGTGIDTVSYSNAIKGVTVSLATTAQQDTIGAGKDTISNFENLTGSSYADTLSGNSANNVLNGGTGTDTMLGGAGNDTYYVDNSLDKVYETKTISSTSGDATGIDTVISTASYYILSAYVENLTLGGSTAIHGTGNTLINTIIGNSAANTLDGGLGNDILSGGAGKDIFVFNSKLGSTNVDTIRDFNVTDDTIHLENLIFTKLTSTTFNSTTKVLNTANFVSNGTKALDSNDFLIYNKADGKLFYDADGSGLGASIQIALIENKAVLTYGDFTVI